MTIQFIDHALNIVLTGLVYGSEAWAIAAFSLYVATHERPLVEKHLGKDTVEKIEQAAITPVSTYPIEPVKITCEPVNWKKWKVSDLRKANIARTCGVRTRPIGSRRNLTKADLIAQYEQQLKRFTKAPARQTTSEKVRITA